MGGAYPHYFHPPHQDIVRAMESDPRLPWRAGLTPANYSALVEHCPSVAAAAFIKLMNLGAPDATESVPSQRVSNELAAV